MSDTGGGHRAAAEAVRDAVEVRYGDRVRVVIADLFREATGPASMLRRIYPVVTRSRRLWSSLYRLGDGRLRAELTVRTLTPGSREAVTRLFTEHQPDLVASFHPFMNAIPQRELDAVSPGTPFVTVVTDLATAHATWFHRGVDLLLAPTEAVAARARRLGVAPERIAVTGLPISPVFSERLGSKPALREALGIAPEVDTVLLVGGGEGMGHLFEIVEAVSATRLPLQLVVVAGRNEALRQRIADASWQVPVIPLGFVRNMPTLMQAADLLVSKAGPGTIMEAVASHLPMILFDYLPGQEEGNVRFVVDHSLGALCTRPAAIAAELARWLADPAALAGVRARAAALARPDAGARVAEQLGELVGA